MFCVVDYINISELGDTALVRYRCSSFQYLYIILDGIEGWGGGYGEVNIIMTSAVYSHTTRNKAIQYYYYYYII